MRERFRILSLALLALVGLLLFAGESVARASPASAPAGDAGPTQTPAGFALPPLPPPVEVPGGTVASGKGSDEDPLLYDSSTLQSPRFDLAHSAEWGWTQAELDAPKPFLILARCTLTTSGQTRDCTIVKASEVVVRAKLLHYLAGLKFEPARRADGTAVAVKEFSIPIRILPSDGRTKPNALFDNDGRYAQWSMDGGLTYGELFVDGGLASADA